MKGLLVRVGIDTTYGHWNAPVDMKSKEFVYVPIPEGQESRSGLARKYSEIIPSLTEFSRKRQKDVNLDLGFPLNLRNQEMHLDPDFDFLTYGDVGTTRGSKMTYMNDGDLIAFYASLRPTEACSDKLIYALVGLYVIEEVVWALEVPESHWNENAHTRRRDIRDVDIIVRGKRNISGRLEKCIPIGKWRDGSYRVRSDLLNDWGGLSVKDGFIQRSAVPPSFLKPEKFYDWFLMQDIALNQRNNSV